MPVPIQVPMRSGVGAEVAGLVEGLGGGGQGELGEAVGAAGLLRVVEGGAAGRSRSTRRTPTGWSAEEAVPEGVDADAAGATTPTPVTATRRALGQTSR